MKHYERIKCIVNTLHCTDSLAPQLNKLSDAFVIDSDAALKFAEEHRFQHIYIDAKYLQTALQQVLYDKAACGQCNALLQFDKLQSIAALPWYKRLWHSIRFLMTTNILFNK